MAFWLDKGSNRKAFSHEIKGKIAVFPKIMIISTDLAISNSMSSFANKYWLNCQYLLAICNFVDKDGTTKMYIPVHPWASHQYPFRYLQSWNTCIISTLKCTYLSTPGLHINILFRYLQSWNTCIISTPGIFLPEIHCCVRFKS